MISRAFSREYAILDGTIVVPYPSEWKIESEGIGWVLFTNSSTFVQVVDMGELGSTFDAESIRLQKIAFLKNYGLDSIRFIEEGRLNIARKNIYFTAVRNDYVYESDSAELFIVVAEGEHQASVQITLLGTQRIPERLRNTAIQVASNLKFLTS